MKKELCFLIVATPVGLWHVYWDEQGLRKATWHRAAPENATEPLAWTILEARTRGRDDPIAHALRDWLQAYRSGSLKTEQTLELVRHYRHPQVPRPPFFERVWQHIAGIPPGNTRSYGEVAMALGRPGAARAVGQAMARNPLPVIVPCHRVVATGRRLGGYSGGTHIKEWILAWEKDTYAGSA